VNKETLANMIEEEVERLLTEQSNVNPELRKWFQDRYRALESLQTAFIEAIKSAQLPADMKIIEYQLLKGKSIGWAYKALMGQGRKKMFPQNQQKTDKIQQNLSTQKKQPTSNQQQSKQQLSFGQANEAAKKEGKNTFMYDRGKGKGPIKYKTW